MRWFWIDKFVEFESGRRAVAVKNVTLGEDHLHQCLPAYPYLPASLSVEGLAQTGGLLIGEYNRFTERVVLAKISKAEFHGLALPGDTLTYTAELEYIKDDGAMVCGTSHVNGQLQAEVDLFFAHLDDRIEEEMFEPVHFLNMLRTLRLFEIGRKADGERLEVPSHLLEAERS